MGKEWTDTVRTSTKRNIIKYQNERHQTEEYNNQTKKIFCRSPITDQMKQKGSVNLKTLQGNSLNQRRKYGKK